MRHLQSLQRITVKEFLDLPIEARPTNVWLLTSHGNYRVKRVVGDRAICEYGLKIARSYSVTPQTDLLVI